MHIWSTESINTAQHYSWLPATHFPKIIGWRGFSLCFCKLSCICFAYSHVCSLRTVSSSAGGGLKRVIFLKETLSSLCFEAEQECKRLLCFVLRIWLHIFAGALINNMGIEFHALWSFCHCVSVTDRLWDWQVQIIRHKIQPLFTVKSQWYVVSTLFTNFKRWRV